MTGYVSLLAETKKYEKINMKKVGITTISNITLEPFFNPWLEKMLYQDNVEPEIKNILYEEYESKSSEQIITDTDILIVWLNLDVLFSDIVNMFYTQTLAQNQLTVHAKELTKKLLQYIKSISNTQVLWIGFEDYYTESSYVIGNRYFCDGIADVLNTNIHDIITNDAIMLDMKRLIAYVGIERAINKKSKYLWNFPYTQEMMSVIAKEILKQYHIINSYTKKCVVIDCDNVLWGGILSEIGIENIVLGEIGEGKLYKDFQRFLLSLCYMGVILAICSKNDLEDVLTVFKLHNEMVLKEEHIAIFQVNWQNKAENIAKLSKSLNIGMDSIIFIDDSYFEIEVVKNFIPEVTTILFTKYMDFKSFESLNLNSKVDLQKISQRNLTYKTNQSRSEFETLFNDYDDFLEALDTSVSIQKSNTIEYGRISELSQRTNKCTNGKRYTVSGLKNMTSSKDYALYSVYVKDRFSDLGLVGVIGIRENTLDIFCLSCRALGRRIEEKMLYFMHKEHDILSFDFLETSKNMTISKNLRQGIPRLSQHK